MQPRVWFITGVSRGIGRAIAQTALDHGDFVIGTSRDGRAMLSGKPDTSCVLPLDVSDRDQVFSCVADALRLGGRIDVVVNNAGYGLIGAIEETSLEEFRHVVEVNFFGAVHVMQAVLPYLRKQRSGHIVNVSSIAGIAAPPGYGFYAAAKYALEGLSLSLRQELSPLGIRVSLVEPGAVRTHFLDDGSIRFAARELADYDTTAGEARRKVPQLRGKERGDPDRCAAAIWQAVIAPEPPIHLVLGSGAVRRARSRLDEMARELSSWEHLSNSANFPEYQ